MTGRRSEMLGLSVVAEKVEDPGSLKGLGFGGDVPCSVPLKLIALASDPNRQFPQIFI